MIPGMNPRQVSAMLIRRSTPHPRSAKTPKGGRIIAKINLQMSMQVKAILIVKLDDLSEN